jgi:hypothetical protein
MYEWGLMVLINTDELFFKDIFERSSEKTLYSKVLTKFMAKIIYKNQLSQIH